MDRPAARPTCRPDGARPRRRDREAEPQSAEDRDSRDRRRAGRRHASRASIGDSSRHLAESDLFGPIEERRFRFVQELDADGVVQRIGSISFVAAAAAEQRAQLEQKLRDLVASKGGSVEFPYVTEVCVSRAV